MKFQEKQRQALRYFAQTPAVYSYPPPGVGERVMEELAENGYLIRRAAWGKWSYQITPKGLKTVSEWPSESALEKLLKWSKAAQKKGTK